MAKGLLQPVTWRSGTLVPFESSLIVGGVVVALDLFIIFETVKAVILHRGTS